MTLSSLFRGNNLLPSGSIHQKKNLAGQTPTLVKAGPTKLYFASIQNIDDAGSVVGNYLKIYDKSSAPTSADTPIAILYQYTIYVANYIQFGLGGIQLTNGLAYRMVNAYTDFGNAFDDLAANQSYCTLIYE